MQNNYIIRKAEQKDIQEIQRLSQLLVEYCSKICKSKYMGNLNWSFSKDGKDNFEEYIEKHVIYVAEIENKIVGYMCGKIIQPDCWRTYNSMELVNLFVMEEYRNMGIGTEFVNLFKKKCKENNINTIKIYTLCDNEKAMDFYKKNGAYCYDTLMFCNLD